MCRILSVDRKTMRTSQKLSYVGKALRNADYFGDYPCHRVVHSDGSLVAGWEEQRTLLEAEHVVFKPSGKVDMKQCLWKISV